jgi:hypothetical protein
MTLKKQFQTLFNNTVVNENRVDKSVKIADEFAIGFAEWITQAELPLEELLKTYKKEQGL